MSIIQQLRDRAAILLTTLIALSLLGFLVQDAFVGGTNNLFAGNTSTVGSINGRSIDAQEFNQRVRTIEESNRTQGMGGNEMMTQNIIENVWNGYIQETLIKGEAEKLGIAFTAKEMSSLLFSEDAPNEFKQLFTDPQTQQFNIDAARTWFTNLKKSKNPDEQKMVTTQLLDPLTLNQIAQKYISLIGQGSYVPKWMVEKLNADNNQFTSLSFVGIPYTAVPDTTIKVSDAEINEYVQKHKEEFKQEKTRSIAYVVFDANPSASDSSALYTKMLQLKEEFKSTADEKGFVTRNGSVIPFFDGFALKSRLAMAAKDSIISMSAGAVVGPYLDGGSYVIAKKLSTRTMPDSVRVRHLLVGIVDPSTGQQRRSDSAASKLADSLFAAIKSGSNFAALVTSFSDDMGSKTTGGEYNFSSMDMGTLAKEFADYAFNNPTGSRAIVKTQFGYHIMEVMNQKNFEEGYKIAYLAKPIVASEETDAKASAAATQFAGNSRDQKSFEASVVKNKLQKVIAENIKEMDYAAAQDVVSRSFVKWIWENKVGTVSEPIDLKDKYIVAVITNDYEKGVQSASVARVMAEPILRNKKKAEVLKKKIGTTTSLETLATANASQVSTIDTLRFADPFIPNLGPEVKVIGAAFNKAIQNKISPVIEGQSGVFVIKPGAIGALPNLATDLESQRKAMQAQLKQFGLGQTFEALKKAAEIEDTRRAAGF